MTQQTTVKIGDTVNVIFAWREDEHPSEANFFTGKVKSIVRRPTGFIYFEIENLSSPVPADRVSAIA